MKYYLLPVTLLYLLYNTVNAQKNYVGLSVIQDGKEIKVTSDTQHIYLKKAEFKLVFNSFMSTDTKPYATMIDVFTDARGTDSIRVGEKIDDIPFFAPGTGMACDMGKQYDRMYIDKDFSQCHYIYYAGKSDNRAKLEAQHGDTLRLSWTVSKISPARDKAISIKKADIKDLYIVVFNDFNLNKVADKGEYIIAHLCFEQ